MWRHFMLFYAVWEHSGGCFGIFELIKRIMCVEAANWKSLTIKMLSLNKNELNKNFQFEKGKWSHTFS